MNECDVGRRPISMYDGYMDPGFQVLVYQYFPFVLELYRKKIVFSPLAFIFLKENNCYI